MIVAGAHLLPDPAGGLYWPAERLLAVADLHFEKAASLARHGAALPPYDTAETLAGLERLIGRHAPRTVVCLGDSFHDRQVAAALPEPAKAGLRRLMRGRDWIWIAGNHDPAPPADLGGESMQTLGLGPLLFRHAPDAARGAAASGEIAGHLHPKAAVRIRGHRLSQPCFVTDQKRLVMPAFGSFTGGLDVFDPAILGLFGRQVRVFLTGGQRMHSFPLDRLDRPRAGLRQGGVGGVVSGDWGAT